MSAPVFTLEEQALGRALHEIGATAVRAEKLRRLAPTSAAPSFDSLDPWQQVGWFTIARHVQTQFAPHHDYTP